MPSRPCACAITFVPRRYTGFADDHVQLLWRELGEFRMICGAEHSACRAHLDHVRPGPEHLPDSLADAVHAIAAAVWKTRICREEAELVARAHPEIHVAAGDCEHRDADLHSRTSNHSAINGVLQSRVSPAGVAHARDARVQRPAHVLNGLIEPRRKGRCHVAREVDAFEHKVHVCIDEAWKDPAAARVDDVGRTARDRDAAGRTDRLDGAVFDEHGGVSNRRSAGAVDQCGVMDERKGHRVADSATNPRSRRRAMRNVRSAHRSIRTRELQPSTVVPVPNSRSFLQERVVDAIVREGRQVRTAIRRAMPAERRLGGDADCSRVPDTAAADLLQSVGVGLQPEFRYAVRIAVSEYENCRSALTRAEDGPIDGVSCREGAMDHVLRFARLERLRHCITAAM